MIKPSLVPSLLLFAFSIISDPTQAWNVQPPNCSFRFQNPAGYKFERVNALERSQITPWTVGLIAGYKKAGATNYTEVFAWANSKGTLIGTYSLPPAANGWHIAFLSDSRATLFRRGFPNGPYPSQPLLIYLTATAVAGTLSAKTAINATLPLDYFATNFLERKNASDLWQTGFIRATQDSTLSFTTMDYFLP